MFSRNSIYTMPQHGAFFECINGDHDHDFRYMSYNQKDKLS